MRGLRAAAFGILLASISLGCGAEQDAQEDAGSGGNGGSGGGACAGLADCAVEHPECRVYVGCQEGVCIYADVADGAPLVEQTPGDCAQAVCDGKGSPKNIPADDPFDDGNPCTLDHCDGLTLVHMLLSETACYTGPTGTLGVGVCVAGVQACDAQGNATGPCVGEVTPADEVCEDVGLDEDCDGAINDKDACCGDGVVVLGEACDDGNADPNDACTPICEPPKCGDGFVQAALGEACDGAANCSDLCAIEAVSFVAAGGEHVCAKLNDGRLKCWGRNSLGQLGLGDASARGDQPKEMGGALPAVEMGSGRTATTIDGSLDHTCALLDDGSVKCWGKNDFGQLGLGDTKLRGDNTDEMGDHLPAVDLGAGRTAKAIAVGSGHSCAVLDDGSLKCWGLGGSGQLGIGGAQERGMHPGEMGDALPAVLLGTGRTALAVAAGQLHTCALLDDHGVKCWGWGLLGQLGQGNDGFLGDKLEAMGDALPEVNLGAGRTALTITAGAAHTCALLDDATVKCWGRSQEGQLGLGSKESRGDGPDEMGDVLPAVDLGANAKVVQIDAGENHTCALLEGGNVKCWGSNSDGELGLGDTAFRGDDPGEMGDALPAVDLGAGGTAVAIAVANHSTCALLADGSVKCWGANLGGQLGLGDQENRGDEPGEMGDALPRVRLFSDAW